MVEGRDRLCCLVFPLALQEVPPKPHPICSHLTATPPPPHPPTHILVTRPSLLHVTPVHRHTLVALVQSGSASAPLLKLARNASSASVSL